MDRTALASRLAALLGPAHPVAAAAVITPAGSATASLGAPEAAEFEIGSVSKGVTGLLYAQARARGEVAGTTTVGDLLPLGSCAAARVRLTALAVHRSGLPTLPLSLRTIRRAAESPDHGTNPYGDTLADLLMQARRAWLRPPVPRYSNMGYQLLGHALAAAAATTYAGLVRRRVAAPLGIGTFSVPSREEDLGTPALRGRAEDGTPQEPWTGEALGPSGGLRATIGDMALFAAVLADGSAPGIEALDPVLPFGASRIGAAWLTSERGGRRVTWHNGMTGGFASWVGVDRDAGTAAVVLTATAASGDGAGERLLAEAGA